MYTYAYVGDAGDRMFGKSIKAPQGGLPVPGTTGEAHPTSSHSSSSGEGAEEGEKEGEGEDVMTKKHKTK